MKNSPFLQVVVLAGSSSLQELLATHDIKVKTVDEVAPVEVHPARVLSKLYAYLGKLSCGHTSVLY